MLKLVIKHYKDLTLDEFHDIISLRIGVFIVEQQSIYNDLDGYDKQCWHLIGTDLNNKIVLTSRIVPPGVKYTEASFGRVVIHPSIRGKKHGHEIIKTILNFTSKKYNAPLKISAMKYLQQFYEGYGFKRIGDPYLDAGVEHIDMIN